MTKPRRSRRHSDVERSGSSANTVRTADALPVAKRLRFSPRNLSVACCTSVEGLPHEFHCDGCQRFKSSTRAMAKGRRETVSKVMQCFQAWKKKEDEVSVAMKKHWNQVIEFIEANLHVDRSALLENEDEDEMDNDNEDEVNIGEAETPVATTEDKKLKAITFMVVPVKSQGRNLNIKIPTTHRIIPYNLLKRYEKDSATLSAVRKKLRASKHTASAFGQALCSIGLAAVPNLALKAAMCLLPVLLCAVLEDAGLFESKFKLVKFAKAFPSDNCYRTMMQRTAAMDTMALGYNLRRYRHVYLSSDKGNKKGVGHFVKCLSWFNFDADMLKVQKQLLDNDASDGKTVECARAIKASLGKVSHGETDALLNGSASDSGGGGVLDDLAEKLQAEGVCDTTESYLVSNCTLHATQLQLANAVKATHGEGGLDRDNVMQMLHCVCDLEECMHTDAWRHTLKMSNDYVHQCANSQDMNADDEDEFATDFKRVVRFFPFKVKLIVETDDIKGSLLEKIQAPVLTRWWTVGVGAEHLFCFYPAIFKAAQVVVNSNDRNSRPWKIASGLYKLMSDPHNFIDVALVKCFHKHFISRHVGWLQSSTDLSGTEGFQAHNIAARCYLMTRQHDQMNVEAINSTHRGFPDYRKSLLTLETDSDRQLHSKKLEVVLHRAEETLHKHFMRWVKHPFLLPAALLSEAPTARVVASVILGRQSEFDVFTSTTHGDSMIDLESLHEFIESRVGDISTMTFEEKPLQAAQLILNGVVFRNISLEDEHQDLRQHMFSKHLPLASQTQFVEFGVKEAKLVSSANRSEETRSCCAIVRSAHVSDKGNSKRDMSNQDKTCRLITEAKELCESHRRWEEEDPEHHAFCNTVMHTLSAGHFESERMAGKQTNISEKAHSNKKKNSLQQQKPQLLTAAVTGDIPYSKLHTTKEGHMEGLAQELLFRGVDQAVVPTGTKARKTLLQELEIKRLVEEDGMPENDAKAVAKKQFKKLSSFEFRF